MFVECEKLMEIVMTPAVTKVTLNSISLGDVFESNGVVYLRAYCGGRDMLGVNIETGMLKYFSPLESVTPLLAEMRIRNT